MNAAIALDLAVSGESLDRNLRKARVAMKSCGAILRVLLVEGHFSDDDYVDVRRRIDRIVAELARLQTLPLAAWFSASATSEGDSSQHSSEGTPSTPHGATTHVARSADEEPVIYEYEEIDPNKMPPDR